MSEIKWISVQTDIFDNRKIKIIEKMPGGDSIIVIWMKLLCLAGQTNDNGSIYLTPEIPYTEDMLATVLGRDLSVVRSALSVFEKLNMIEIVDDFISLPSWEKYQNIEGMERVREQTKKRVQNYRERQKKLLSDKCNVTVTLRNAPEEDIQIEKEKEYIDTPSNWQPDGNQMATKAPLIEELFLKFWKAYPKKVGKQDALKSFKKIKPSKELVEKMVSVIEDAKNTEQWTKNGGQYIPNPSTWLNQGRWDDDISTYTRRSTSEGREISNDRFAGIDY